MTQPGADFLNMAFFIKDDFLFRQIEIKRFAVEAFPAKRFISAVERLEDVLQERRR